MHQTLTCCLALILTLPTLAGCSMQPKVQSVNARIAAIDLDGVDLAFDVGVNNGLPVAIRGPSGRYRIDIADAPFIQSDTVPPIDLPAQQIGTVTLPARVRYAELWKMYNNLGDAAQVAYGLSGTLICPVAGKTFELPFSHTGDLPVLRVPRFVVVDVRAAGVSLSGATVEVDVKMFNPNIFPIGIRDVGYDLRLGDIHAGRLSAATAENIDANGVGIVTLSFELQSTQAASRLLRGGGLGKPQLDTLGEIQTPYGAVRLPR